MICIPFLPSQSFPWNSNPSHYRAKENSFWLTMPRSSRLPCRVCRDFYSAYRCYSSRPQILPKGEIKWLRTWYSYMYMKYNMTYVVKMARPPEAAPAPAAAAAPPPPKEAAAAKLGPRVAAAQPRLPGAKILLLIRSIVSHSALPHGTWKRTSGRCRPSRTNTTTI